MGGGLLFVAMLLYFTSDIAFQRAITKVLKRLFKTVGLSQLATVLSAMAFVKYGLEPVIKLVRNVTKAQGPWEKSPEYYILKEVIFADCTLTPCNYSSNISTHHPHPTSRSFLFFRSTSLWSSCF